MLLKTFTVTSLIASVLLLMPQTDAHAGKLGKALGAAAAGAAVGYGVHKIIKHKKKKKRTSRNTRHKPKGAKRNAYRKSGSGVVSNAETFNHQTWLTDLGYEPGAIDGRSGKNTRRAIIAFQKDHGYRATGKLTKQEASHLERAASSVKLAVTQPDNIGSPAISTPSQQIYQNTKPVTPQVQTPVIITPIISSTQSATEVEPINSELSQPNIQIVNEIEPPSDFVKPTLFGIAAGSDVDGAMTKLSENGLEQCNVENNLISCETKREFGNDSVKLAILNDRIHTIKRKLVFKSKISAQSVLDRMPESYSDLTKNSKHKIASSKSCDAILLTNNTIFEKLITTSATEEQLGKQSLSFAEECAYYFKIDKPEGEAINEISLTFFDASPILTSSKNTTLAENDELKF